MPNEKELSLIRNKQITKKVIGVVTKETIQDIHLKFFQTSL